MTELSPKGYPLRQIKSWVRRENPLAAFEVEFLQSSKTYIRSLEDLKAHWDAEKALGKPLFLDIGCGDGQSTVQLAQWAPKACITGVETHTPGLAKGLVKAHLEGLTNLSIFQGDVWDILDRKWDVTFDRVHLYFSDPWPKSRHHKRRLVQVAFLEALRPHLSEGSIVHIATDWAPYAEHISEVLCECSWLDWSDKPFHPVESQFFRSPTKYERKGIEKGHAIFEFYIQLQRAF